MESPKRTVEKDCKTKSDEISRTSRVKEIEMIDQTVTLKLTRDEVSELKRLLIKEATWVGTAVGVIGQEIEKELDDLRQKIHDQI
jgi:hypothetical protein